MQLPGRISVGTPEGVSILTRPEGRMQPFMIGITDITTTVSILTRPEGRMQQANCVVTLVEV